MDELEARWRDALARFCPRALRRASWKDRTGDKNRMTAVSGWKEGACQSRRGACGRKRVEAIVCLSQSHHGKIRTARFEVETNAPPEPPA